MTVTMAPRIVRAIHVAGWVAGDDAGWVDMLNIAATTGINTLMIDVKNENGDVYFDDLGVATVGDLGALSEPSTSLVDRVGDARSVGLYTIARIVTFQDPIVAEQRPEWAVIDSNTGRPMERNGQNFLDPYDPDAQRYAIDLRSTTGATGTLEGPTTTAGAGSNGRSDAGRSRHAQLTTPLRSRPGVWTMGS